MKASDMLNLIMACGLALILVIATGKTSADPGIDPMVEIRCCQNPIKLDKDGHPYRSAAVYNEFRRQNPCPSTGLTTGACPGHQVNHAYPLDCGGFDAVWNMLWMSTIVKVSANIGHDRYERKIHGTGNCTAVPLGGIVYPAKHGTLNY